MNLIDMFYTEIEDCKARKVPLIIPIGTMEYHAEHASLGCDTMVITGMLERLGKRKEIIVAPPIWYGVASYAVCGPEKNTIQVDVDPYEAYITEILKSLVYGGWKNIYLVFHHQSEGNGLMPMSLACMKAAKKVTMRYLEEKRGYGWWGSNDMQNYYENLDTDENPLTFIKTIQLMDEQGYVIEAVYFGNIPEFMDFLSARDKISVTYYPEINRYQGRETLQVIIQNYC